MSILMALKKLGLIDANIEVGNDNHTGPLQQEAQSSEGSASSNDENGSDTEDAAITSNQGNDIENWTKESVTHAAPTVTMDQYEKMIMDGFMTTPLITVKGVVDAYGLSHKKVIQELLSISKGDLKMHLNEEVDQW